MRVQGWASRQVLVSTQLFATLPLEWTHTTTSKLPELRDKLFCSEHHNEVCLVDRLRRLIKHSAGGTKCQIPARLRMHLEPILRRRPPGSACCQPHGLLPQKRRSASANNTAVIRVGKKILDPVVVGSSPSLFRTGCCSDRSTVLGTWTRASFRKNSSWNGWMEN